MKHMALFGEIVLLLVLFAGVVGFGFVAWRLTLHVIGVDRQELVLWTDRLREKRKPELSSD